MKRFQFQLQSVLDFKQKALEDLMVELDQALSRMMAQEYKRDQAQEQQLLEQRERELETKREQVIDARQETRAIEKLKELRRGEYDAAALKEEEKMLDDLTAARRAQAVS